jgi:hypothetical protein
MDFTAAQVEVVKTVVGCAGANRWDQIFVDAEIDEGDDGFSLSTVSFAVTPGTEGQPVKLPFSIDIPGQDAMVALYRQRREEAGDRITGFDLTVEPDGRFRFRFSHDEPKRARGQWDADKAKRLENYLSWYQNDRVG